MFPIFLKIVNDVETSKNVFMRPNSKKKKNTKKRIRENILK